MLRENIWLVVSWLRRAITQPFAELNRWLRVFKLLLVHESRRLAAVRGPFPAIPVSRIEALLMPSCGREVTEALRRQYQLRHRHLLTLSPFAFLPPGAPDFPLPDYLQLLPALKWGDTIALIGAEKRQLLGLKDYQRMLRMTWAIARNRA